MKKFVVGSALIGEAAALSVGANPIRRVVTLLQDMQKEIEVEGAKEEELYKKFMCYCKNNDGQLEEDAKKAQVTIEQNNAAAAEKSARKKQTEEELKQHKKDRKDATSTLEQATALRKKEKAAYVEAAGDTRSYIDATKGAVAALKKGKGGAFLQTGAASYLKNLVQSKASEMMDANDRSTVMAFLEQNKDYVPQGGEIIGILENMLDEFDKSLGGIVSTEDEAVKNFAALKAAKEEEIAAATSSIEAKTELKGKLAVEIVQHKAAAEAAVKELSDAQEFLVNLKQMCADKEADWEARSSERAQEVAAIGQAIAVLNDDDALDIFKASVGGPKSFMQVSKAKSSPQARAVNMLQKKFSAPAVALLAHTAVSKLKEGVDFSKVITMIDEMVELLKKEQTDDETTKQWCEEEMRNTETEKKETANKIKSLESEIGELEAAIAANNDTVAKQQETIAELDTSVAEATKQREAENSEFTEAVSLNTSAIQLIEKAKNKLNKFYNPGMYKEAPQREPTEEERIAIAAGEKVDLSVETTIEGTTQSLYLQTHAPPPPPETYGEYKKKGQKSNSIIALMDMLINDLKKEVQGFEHDEKTSQRDYEQLMGDAQASKAEALKTITDTQAATAGYEEDLQVAKTGKASKEAEHGELEVQLADLHKQCDFIVAHFEERRAARDTEIEGLKSAKAVLSGADYAFLL